MRSASSTSTPRSVSGSAKAATIRPTIRLLEPKPSAYVQSLGPDRFETSWSWDDARRQAQAVYERYYHIGH